MEHREGHAQQIVEAEIALAEAEKKLRDATDELQDAQQIYGAAEEELDADDADDANDASENLRVAEKELDEAHENESAAIHALEARRLHLDLYTRPVYFEHLI